MIQASPSQEEQERKPVGQKTEAESTLVAAFGHAQFARAE